MGATVEKHQIGLGDTPLAKVVDLSMQNVLTGASTVTQHVQDGHLANECSTAICAASATGIDESSRPSLATKMWSGR